MFNDNLLTFSLEFIPSPFGGNFFEEYSKLNPKGLRLKDALLPTLSALFDYNENYKITGRISYYNWNLTDIYNQMVLNNTIPKENDKGSPGLSIVESISGFQIPFLMGLQFSPLRSQYSNYLGVQVGLNISNTNWQTTSRSISNSILSSRPAININGISLDFSYRFYTGFELRFDSIVSNTNPLRGVFLEISYFDLPILRGYFERIINESKGLFNTPSNGITRISTGGISISIGATIQFYNTTN